MSAGTAGLGPNAALVNRLKNRGPVTISTENPFLAGNLLLTKEVERSEEVRGFIKHRGSPAAIEVRKEFFTPLTMQFYYPETRQQYSLELAEGVWVIAGPTTIDREKMKEILALLRGQSTQTRTSQPDEQNQSHTAPGSDPATQHSSTDGTEDPFLERLEKASQDESFRSPAQATQQQSAADTPLTLPTPAVARTAAAQPSDSQVISALAKKYGGQNAEISPQGDLVHYVTYSGETLPMIARWYTFDRTNADKLARINNLRNPHTLSVGDMVVIPSYMLKNKSRMSEKAVQELSGR